MKHGALIAFFVAAAFAVAQAQLVPTFFPNFPYCQCIRSPSPYSVEQTVVFRGNNTYCFTIDVKQPAWNATGYCASKADIKKIEINANLACDVFGPVVNATLNGIPTRVGAAFATPEQGPNTTRILRFTQLNLGLQSDGAQLCIKLGINANGRGCTTLEQLCVPPAGAPPGACSIALFDSKQDCCPITRVNVPSPPPTPPSPPPPPPPPPANTTCTSCAYLTLAAGPLAVFPVSMTEDQCNQYAAAVYASLEDYASGAGAAIIPGTATVTCFPDKIKMCATFSSQSGGASLQPLANQMASDWLNYSLVDGSCPAWLDDHTVTVQIAGDGSDFDNPPTSSCLNGRATVICTPKEVAFPKCFCDTKRKSTQFAALPVLTSEPGRPSNKTNSTLYCFTLALVDPIWPKSPCGSTTILHKAELWGNDAPTQRRKVLAVGIQASDRSTMSFLAPSWGKKDEQTLKASPLNWTPQQADGAKICLELSGTDINTFCLGGTNSCWINFFSPDKQCCPVFSATLPPQ